jgi:hypothetical protein
LRALTIAFSKRPCRESCRLKVKLHDADVGKDMNKLVRRARNLELPMGALFAMAELRDRLRDAEAVAVQAARERGASWEDIAHALGVTRQALHQRYAPAAKPRSA